MKSFIISVMLIVLTVALIVGNAFFFNRTVGEIEHLLYLLPSEPDTGESDPEALKIFSKLDGMIEECGDYYQLFIPTEELRLLFSAIRESEEYYNSGDYPTYLATLRQAKECVVIVRLNESVSWKNIL